MTAWMHCAAGLLAMPAGSAGSRRGHWVRVGAAAALIALTVAGARADWRAYVWTYEYQTVPRGAAELETYLTFSTPDLHDTEGNTWTEHRLELEVGMTDRFDFAIYQIFGQGPNEGLSYEGYQLRGRYRIGEKGRYPLDPLIYIEYAGVADFAEHAIEAKLVLARDFGATNLAINPVLEFEREHGEWEVETEYAVGLSYHWSPFFKAGLEARGSEYGHYVGPVVSHGRGDLWTALGSAIRVSDIEAGRPELEVRLLVGLGIIH